jgi:hypothetical protein
LLLLITGSADGTSDLLVSKLGQERVFRFNYDLFQDYQLEFRPNYWKISNPTGHSISSETVSSAFWWKAFNFFLLDQEKLIVEEVKYIFREIYHWCRLRGIAKGNPHDFHNHLGKMNILSIADKYFATPETLATFGLAGVDSIKTKKVVAKSFTSGLTTTNKALFTSAVDLDKLHPDFPWYLQELIESNADVTIFVCGKKYFSYKRSRIDLKGLDWRSEQTFEVDKKEWVSFNLDSAETRSLESFCEELDVNWGRLDLMTSVNGLVFLEFNANGQWVFLDYFNQDGLLDEVCSYLMS